MPRGPKAATVGLIFFPTESTSFTLRKALRKPENNAIFVGSLDSKDRKLLVKASSNPIYVTEGYLLYNRLGTLMAQPIDADRLQLTGDAVPIAEGVAFNPFGSYAPFSASDNGVLVYRGGGGAVPLTLEWVSRDGAAQPLAATPHNYTFPRISPDGKRVAVGIEEAWRRPGLGLRHDARCHQPADVRRDNQC